MKAGRIQGKKPTLGTSYPKYAKTTQLGVNMYKLKSELRAWQKVTEHGVRPYLAAGRT